MSASIYDQKTNLIYDKIHFLKNDWFDDRQSHIPLETISQIAFSVGNIPVFANRGLVGVVLRVQEGING